MKTVMKSISKKEIKSWLERIIQSRTLVAPTRVKDLVLFKKISQPDDVVLDFVNTAMSPKEWFFPPSEILFSVKKKDGQVELVPNEIEKETVIFGIRPCDARGIALLDIPYLKEPADALFLQHRKKSILVGLSCLTACPECFCTSMGSSPNDTSNLDIMLTEVKDGYIVQAITEKGKALVPGDLLTATAQNLPLAPSLPAVPSEGITEKMRKHFDNKYWNLLADRCIHCNICSYVCPTCYCFDVRDYNEKGRIERVRSWESCQSSSFTKIAGGHNPRPSKGARMRQRFSHKLFYFPEEFGPLHCVGCGRCVKSCPVNIDIREIMQNVQELGAKE